VVKKRMDSRQKWIHPDRSQATIRVWLSQVTNFTLEPANSGAT